MWFLAPLAAAASIGGRLALGGAALAGRGALRGGAFALRSGGSAVRGGRSLFRRGGRDGSRRGRNWFYADGGGGQGAQYGLQVKGLTELLRALQHVEGDVDKEMGAELRAVGNTVRDRARANAPVLSGRLRSSVKTSVRQTGVSVYSNLPYASVQDQGGRVGKGAVIPRARASAYMTKAAAQSQGEVAQAIDGIGDWIERAYASGGNA